MLNPYYTSTTIQSSMIVLFLYKYNIKGGKIMLVNPKPSKLAKKSNSEKFGK